MLSTRHNNHIRHIRAGGAALTKREREKSGLAPSLRAARRAVPDVPFPAEPERFDWFVLYVRPRSERLAAWRIDKSGFAAYCPMARVEARMSRTVKHRRHETLRPILTSMVLVGFDKRFAPPWLRLLDYKQCPEVQGVIGFNGRPARLSNDAIIRLHQMDGMRDRTRRYTPILGDHVRVTDGAWFGAKGKVVEVSHGSALVKLLGLTGVFADVCEPARISENWLERA